MILSVDTALPLPAYEQMREQIERMVAVGTLRPGTRLPTIRQLAADLGLAKGTVARAYELLEADAVVETRGRHGTYVVERPKTRAPERRTAIREAADRAVVTAIQVDAGPDELAAAIDAAWRRLRR